MPGRSGGPFGPAAIGLAAALAVLLAAASPPPAVVLGPDGDLFSWRPGGAGLVRVPFPGEARRVNDLAPAGPGRILVLLAPEAGGRDDTREGEAAVVDFTDPGAPRIIKRITFEGEGLRVATADDGLVAYVLANEPARSKRESGQDWIHQIDLQTGRKTGSSVLERPPMAIVAAPGGERVYVGVRDRILTFTTRPLAGSWRYRSPGANQGLAFPPRSGVLHSVRDREIALFDPAVIAARGETERRRAVDDASALVHLPIEADTLLISGDRPLAVAWGRGNHLAFIDLVLGTAIVNAEIPPAVREAARARPIGFRAEGGLIVACFPALEAVAVPLPRTAEAARIAAEPPRAAPPAPPPSPTPSAEASPAPATPGDGPRPLPPPGGSPSAAPLPAGVLAGRLSGEVGLVSAVAAYGPGSLVLEAARAVPAADGSWEIRVQAPGVYRILPLGRESRPLRSAPNFHTVEVRDSGRGDLDFRILGTP
jgi:hypothetical protein